MEQLKLDLSSPSWWIGVVIVGIIINIISTPLSRIFEKNLGQIFNWQAQKSKERAKAHEAFLKLLQNNENKQLLYAIQEHRYRIRSLEFLVFSLFSIGLQQILLFLYADIIRDSNLMLTGSTLLAIIGIISMIICIEDYRTATKIKKNLTEINPDIFLFL